MTPYDALRKIRDRTDANGIYYIRPDYDAWGDYKAAGWIEMGKFGRYIITFLGRVALAVYDEEKEETGPAEVRR